jgi:anti-anti-sigma factor
VGAVGIAMVGELDVAAADEARDVISRAQGAASVVICDLHDVSFIDPRGLHVLLDAAASARRSNARLTLANPSPSVRRLIRLVGLDATLATNDPLTPAQPRGSLTTKSTPLTVRSSRRAPRQDRRR